MQQSKVIDRYSAALEHCGQDDSQALVHAIVRAVATKKCLSVDQLLSPLRCRRPIADARHQAMYLSHVVAGLTMSRVGEAFGRDRTTIRHACARVEDKRDDSVFDEYISDLEAEIEQLKGAMQ